MFITALFTTAKTWKQPPKGPSTDTWIGVPVVAQWLTNLIRNHEVAGTIPGLAQCIKDQALP